MFVEMKDVGLRLISVCLSDHQDLQLPAVMYRMSGATRLDICCFSRQRATVFPEDGVQTNGRW